MVIGSGSFGTAAAVMLLAAGTPVTLFGRDAAKIAELERTRRHPQLGDQPLPAGLAFSADPTIFAHADLALWAVPTQHTRSMAVALRPHLPATMALVSLAKGFEEESLLTPCAVLQAVLGSNQPCAALSGPSHAHEIVAGKPACLVAAGPEALVRLLQARLHGPLCRVYSSSDLIGVEIAGALKNVIAIAAGLCDGLGFGDNVKAALITRGLAEMRRLGRACGAQDRTFSGMAGIGDLMTTCYAPHGRNRALGKAIATGANPLMFLRQQQTVAEGAWTCRAAVELARRNAVELPIASQVAAIIWQQIPVREALDALFARSPKEEDA